MVTLLTVEKLCGKNMVLKEDKRNKINVYRYPAFARRCLGQPVLLQSEHVCLWFANRNALQ
jgi:hypothetical protein